MAANGHPALASTTEAGFKASGEEQAFSRWLARARPDLSKESRRQIRFYARQLIQIFGAQTPELVAESPARLAQRIHDLDLAACGLTPDKRRHLLRAARALHAARRGLDTTATRRLMDCRTRRKPARRRGSPTARTDAAAVDDLVARMPEAGQQRGPAAAPEPTGSRRSPAVSHLVEALNHQLTVQGWVDDSLDVRQAARAVVSPLSPAAQLRLIAAVPGAHRLPVVTGRSAHSPADVAEEALVFMLANQADLRTG